MPDRQGNKHTPQRLLLSFLKLNKQVAGVLRRCGGPFRGPFTPEVRHQLSFAGSYPLHFFLPLNLDLTQVLLGQVEEERLTAQRRLRRLCGSGECFSCLKPQRLNIKSRAGGSIVDTLGQLRRARLRVGAPQIHVSLFTRGKR